MHFAISRNSLAVIAVMLACLSTRLIANQVFSIASYFDVRRVQELALSSDGQWLAYAVASPSLAQNVVVRQVYVQHLASEDKNLPLKELSDARELSWIPGTH